MKDRKRCAVALLLAIALGGPAGAETEAGFGEAEPKLVVLIVVDQLRRDRLDADLPGGLGRLAREGRVHVDAALDHATTETCPGHVSIATGRHPGPAGAPTNNFIDPKTGERRYCVEDRSADAAVIGGGSEPEDGRSPRTLRVPALATG